MQKRAVTATLTSKRKQTIVGRMFRFYCNVFLYSPFNKLWINVFINVYSIVYCCLTSFQNPSPHLMSAILENLINFMTILRAYEENPQVKRACINLLSATKVTFYHNNINNTSDTLSSIHNILLSPPPPLSLLVTLPLLH